MGAMTTTRQRGFGLIEALVAMAVLSIGLIGLARLQTHGLRASYTATQRMVAVQKAEEIVERMRANPSGVLNANGASNYDIRASSSFTDHGCDDRPGNAAQACTSAQIAEHDYTRWTTALTEAMPGMTPTGDIAVQVATTPPTVTVTIRWTERAGAQSYATTQQL